MRQSNLPYAAGMKWWSGSVSTRHSVHRVTIAVPAFTRADAEVVLREAFPDSWIRYELHEMTK